MQLPFDWFLKSTQIAWYCWYWYVPLSVTKKQIKRDEKGQLLINAREKSHISVPRKDWKVCIEDTTLPGPFHRNQRCYFCLWFFSAFFKPSLLRKWLYPECACVCTQVNPFTYNILKTFLYVFAYMYKSQSYHATKVLWKWTNSSCAQMWGTTEAKVATELNTEKQICELEL